MYEYNLGLRFQTIVQQHGSRTAIWFNQHTAVSYDQLNRLANKLARLLIEAGVSRRDLVCLSGEKRLDTFAAQIACLKIGAIYCFLDPDSPAERLRKIIATCNPRLLLAGAELLERLDQIIVESGITFLGTDSPAVRENRLEDTNLTETSRILGSEAAYVMFTSGSTGIPKGAVMTHANVSNFIDWTSQTFAITPDDRITNVNPLYFDNSVFDVFAALFSGATLVPFSKEEVKDPGLLVNRIDSAQCTLWFSVPSLLMFLQTMKALDGKYLRSITRFVFGGEGYPKSKLKQLFDVYSGSSELFNVYGPTECTCICSSHKLTVRDFKDLNGLPALGQIASNFEYLILDDHERLAPQGEIGELCLLGPNVGKGYYRDHERTAESFVQNPYNDSFAEIMYKTGDLVRIDPADGLLYIHGRKDNQIKHMGYRIELEEIEAALHCLDYIREATVFQANMTGLSRIVALVSCNETVDDDLIRRDLKQLVPDYMIPSIFHREAVLPKNANGKIDRRLVTAKYGSQ